MYYMYVFQKFYYAVVNRGFENFGNMKVKELPVRSHCVRNEVHAERVPSSSQGYTVTNVHPYTHTWEHVRVTN